MKRLFLTVLLLGCFGIIFLCITLGRVGSEPVNLDVIDVPKGTTIYGLHEALDLDSPSWAYKLWIRKNHPDFSLSAGSYPVTGDATVETLFSEILLYQPQAKDISITILPGWHIGEVENYLNAEFGVSNSEFDLVTRNKELVRVFSAKFPFLVGVASLEGFLYPDTYRVYPDASLEDIVGVMLEGFRKNVYEQYSDTTGELGFYDTLKLASIIEEEEKNDSNKSMVAGIYKKRLDEGWQLGADATLCYEGLVLGDECRAFVNSYYSLPLSTRKAKGYVYDTRISVGLPPTPISSVSASTFDSVVNHKENEYYYYLHDSRGQIHYGRTGAEHEENKRKYIY